MNCDPGIPAAANILVVDDLPENLRLLSGMLGARGYRVRPVPSGELALQAVHHSPPELILLDINMPEMDGFEVCRRLKEDPRWAAIPVIFISALDDTVDKVKGFDLGAVDYVTKPFHFEEVQARVQTHLELARLRQQLQQHGACLERVVAQRTQELAEAKARLSLLDQAKTDFLSLISHEVRTPLIGIFGVTEMLLENHAGDPSMEDWTRVYEESRRRLMTLIDDALLLARIGQSADAGANSACPLDGVLTEAMQQASPFAESRQVRFAPPSANLGWVMGSAEHLAQALRSLLETAVKFARDNTLVRLTTVRSEGSASMTIETEGAGIPAEALPRFFELLAIADPITPGGDLGLAPALAHRILALYGGTVSVENLDPPGIRFTLRMRGGES